MRGYRLDDGSWFVRGTENVQEAFTFLLKEYNEEMVDQVDWQIDHEDDEPVCDFDIEFKCHEAGLWRFVPCAPNLCGEHGWHLHSARKRGRGVFPGVQFDSLIAVPIEYDDGIDKDPWLEETVTTSDNTEERVSA